MRYCFFLEDDFIGAVLDFGCLPMNVSEPVIAMVYDSSNGAETPSSSSEFILASSCDIKLIDGMTIGERDNIESLLSKGVYTHET